MHNTCKKKKKKKKLLGKTVVSRATEYLREPCMCVTMNLPLIYDANYLSEIDNPISVIQKKNACGFYRFPTLMEKLMIKMHAWKKILSIGRTNK